ncbi:MAG: TlpA disulfide reductase family protein [Salinivirgaceae bacterium]|jgi:cytochrome c biogenesis protein CcmG/thiol:disulfide interchange protein DsbE|nr:TlpA disulfide reductase family protein [Salinivirgaceae bacterium]
MRSIILGVFLLAAAGLFAQDIPSVNVKSLSGEIVNTNTFANDGKPMIISLWATWCKPCVKELDAYNDYYADWVDETGVKVFAISTDDSRSSSRVAPYVNARGWEIPVYLDENSDFKRAMNVANVPHTFLLDGKGKVVWQHTSYVEGDEEELYEKLLELSK